MMTTPLRPFERLVRISIDGKEHSLPENNTLLRGLQYLAPEDVSYGPFCWNADCGSCLVEYDFGEGTAPRRALSCTLMVAEGMRVHPITAEGRYCVRSLNAKAASA